MQKMFIRHGASPSWERRRPRRLAAWQRINPPAAETSALPESTIRFSPGSEVRWQPGVL
jgi:hypothetical protein